MRPDDNQPAERQSPQPPGKSIGPLPPVELLWKSLTDSIDCFVMVLDRDLRIQYLNRVDAGYKTVDDVLGKELLNFVAAESRETVRRILEKVFATGTGAAYDVGGIDLQGEETSYSIRVSPVEQEGRIVAAVITAIDSRKLHDTERQLRADRQALRQFIRTQERERQLISYEIHDGLAQYLAGAMMQFEACEHAIRSRQPREIDEVVKSFEEGMRLVREAVVESRRLINGLRPPMLDELGIIEAIESLVVDARAEIRAVEYERPVNLPRLDPNVETILFRVVQESLSNIRKHARADRVRVVLERRGEADIAAVVEDDGVGFDPAQVPEGCFGLEGIRQRARLLGREAEISAVPGKGTRIEIVVPLFPAMAGGSGGDPPFRNCRD